MPDINCSRRASIILILVLIVLGGKAQNQNKADSILLALETNAIDPSMKIEALYWLSTYSTSPLDELKYGEELLQLAQKKNDQEYITRAKLRMGVANRLMGNLSEALGYLFDAAETAFDAEKSELLLIEIYPEIAACYTLNNDQKNALLYGEKTVDILRKSDRKQELALNLLNLGYDYYLDGNYEKALAVYEESETILEDIDLEIGLAYIKGNRALILWKQKLYPEAKSDLIEAINRLKPLGDGYGMADYYNQLASLSRDINELDNAIEYAEEALKLAKDLALKEQIRDASLLLFDLYESNGDYELSNYHQGQYHFYKDSIQNQKTSQEIADLRTQYEVGRKQAEIDLLAQRSKNERLVLILISALLVIVIGFSITVYNGSKLRKKLNEKLEEQKQKLITLNEVKDKFFAIISHDLRGPATRFKGLMGVINKDSRKIGEEEMKELLNLMEISATDLVQLLQRMLDWSSEQKGHFPYRPESVLLHDLLQEVFDLYQQMMISKQINLDYKKSKEVKVFVDKNSTLAIFRNVLSNAIKFTPNGGNIKVLAENENGYVKITFSDTGVGIPADELGSIFSENNRASQNGTSGEQGLGMGLQLVNEFVLLNKGRIAIESIPQKGTDVIISLPEKA